MLGEASERLELSVEKMLLREQGKQHGRVGAVGDRPASWGGSAWLFLTTGTLSAKGWRGVGAGIRDKTGEVGRCRLLKRSHRQVTPDI